MKKCWLFLLIPAMPSLAVIPTDPCVVRGASVEMSMVSAMTNDLGIDEKNIHQNKTEMELLSKTKVLPPFARQLAKRSQQKSGSGTSMNWNDYYSMYTDDNVVNLVVKYTFYNKEDKKSVFIGSNLINDNECSVSFGGYITVSREF